MNRRETIVDDRCVGFSFSFSSAANAIIFFADIGIRGSRRRFIIRPIKDTAPILLCGRFTNIHVENIALAPFEGWKEGGCRVWAIYNRVFSRRAIIIIVVGTVVIMIVIIVDVVAVVGRHGR